LRPFASTKENTVKKFLFVLVVAGAVTWGAAPAQAQSTCPPGQSGNAPYCVTLPPLPPAACNLLTSKLALARATIDRIRRTISILAPITRLASGNASITLRAAGRSTTFSAPVDSANGRIRITRAITPAQARLGTGILTITYPGDADTRPQVVRLRAANGVAALSAIRPVITAAGFLRGEGTVSTRARGVVRTQLQFVDGATGETVTLERNATIQNGRWSLNAQIPADILARLLRRCGTVHSYTLFTGYMPARMRGEMRSFQVLPAP
jgi:hypothetical protein